MKEVAHDIIPQENKRQRKRTTTARKIRVATTKTKHDYVESPQTPQQEQVVKDYTRRSPRRQRNQQQQQQQQEEEEQQEEEVEVIVVEEEEEVHEGNYLEEDILRETIQRQSQQVQAIRNELQRARQYYDVLDTINNNNNNNNNNNMMIEEEMEQQQQQEQEEEEQERKQRPATMMEDDNENDLLLNGARENNNGTGTNEERIAQHIHQQLNHHHHQQQQHHHHHTKLFHTVDPQCPSFSTAKLKCRLVPPSEAGFMIGESLRLYVENHNNCPISICLLFRPYAEHTDVWLPARDLPLANDMWGNDTPRGKYVTRASDYMAIYPNMTEQIRIMDRDFHSLQSHEEIVLTIPTAKLPRIQTAQVGSRVQFMLLATTLKTVNNLRSVVHGFTKARQKVAHCSFSVAIKDDGYAYRLSSGLPLATAKGATTATMTTTHQVARTPPTPTDDVATPFAAAAEKDDHDMMNDHDQLADDIDHVSSTDIRRFLPSV